MPIPAVFIGIAAVTGTSGVGTTIKAKIDDKRAKGITEDANKRIEYFAQLLDVQRKACNTSLQRLGEEKITILNSSITDFVRSFKRIKNIDFSESKGIEELNAIKMDRVQFEELDKLTRFSVSLCQGGVIGVASGALAAFGAYSAATSFAAASTGTAIASLSGAAATNATLAFFGGGALAAGGLGIAGGTVILGGLVAGPALMVMGIVTGAKAGKKLQDAYANDAKAYEICEELWAAFCNCSLIRQRCYMFYSLLAKLDSYLYPLNQELKRIIEEEGCDYSQYTSASKHSVAAAVSTVASIKSVLDTTILTESGDLTKASELIIQNMINE